MQYATLKRLSTPTRLYGAISQKAVVLILARDNLKSHNSLYDACTDISPFLL
jgi:hypothetical protein